MPRIVFSIYLWLFFLDGTCSLVDDVFHQSGDFSLLYLRNSLALVAFLAGLLILPFLVFDGRFPKRILFPLIFFLIWTNLCYAFPLNLEPLPYLNLVLSFLQFLAGGCLLFFFCEPGTLKPFHYALGRRAFTWKNTLIAGGSVLAGIFVILPFFLLGQLVSGVSSYTGGYLILHHDGLYLTERRFQKGDREIRLISMMHVGRKEFYQELAADLPVQTRSVVLLEGVTNNKQMKAPSLNYDKVAEAVGLTSQSQSEFQELAERHLEEQKTPETKTSPIDFRQADVDLGDLEPRTLEFIDLVGQAYRSSSWREFKLASDKLGKAFPENEDSLRVVNDIINKRNDHLFGIIEKSLLDYPIVLVPWGALHLSDIQARIAAQGYEQTFSKERKVLSFW